LKVPVGFDLPKVLKTDAGLPFKTEEKCIRAKNPNVGTVIE